MGKEIKSLFEANSIAIIGASSNPSKIGGRPIKYLLDQRYKGIIYPVNSRYDKILGFTSFPDVNLIPETVDLAILAIAAEYVEEEIIKCIHKGIQSYVVFSSGFSEAGETGRKLQNRLKDLADKHNLNILGPNCLGMINVSSGLVASFTTALESLRLVEGGLGFVSQSGALAAYFLDLVQKSGVGLSKWISTGNEVTLETSDFVDYLVDDPDTKVIGVYLEDIKNGELFKRSAIRAAQKGKPIILIKAGSSEAGRKAAASHTGSITGEDSKYQALFEQLGIIRVRSLSEMIRVSKTLLYQGFPITNTLGVISVSGGAGVLIADEAAKVGLKVPDFDKETKEKLKSTIPSFATVQNPMDVTGHVVSDISIFSNTLEILNKDTKVSNIVIFLGLMKSISNELFHAIKDINLEMSKHISVIWVGATDDIVKKFSDINIPVYKDIPDAIETLSQLYKGYQNQKLILNDLSFISSINESLKEQGRNMLSSEGNHLQYLTEYDTKRLFDGYQIPIPKEALVMDVDEAKNIIKSKEISFPVVLKIQSVDMLHKSELGGLLLSIENEDQMIAGINKLLTRVKDLNISCQGILIQEMVKFDQELIIDIQKDASLGTALVVGRGGIYVEVLKDITTMYLPISKVTLINRIKGLKSSKLFEGYRGKKKIDLDKLADVILEICQVFYDNQDEISELEINPLAINSETGDFWIIDGLGIKKAAKQLEQYS